MNRTSLTSSLSFGLLAATLHLPLHAATAADHLFVGDHIITMHSIEDAPTAKLWSTVAR